MKQVDAGAALLDERLPGWRDEVNPDRLDMETCSECVLGQLFGEYERGAKILGIFDPGQTTRYGFYATTKRQYTSLVNAWRRVLQKEAA